MSTDLVEQMSTVPERRREADTINRRGTFPFRSRHTRSITDTATTQVMGRLTGQPQKTQMGSRSISSSRHRSWSLS